MDNINTPDLEQSPDSFLRPGETLEDFNVEFRRPNAQGGRTGFMEGKLVKQGPNTGKWVVRDLYSRGDKRGSTVYFNSETEASKAIADRKKETGKQQTNAELTKKYKSLLKEEGYKSWADAPKDVKKKLKNKMASKYVKVGPSTIKEKTIKLLEEKKPINPKTGLPYTQEEYIKLTPGQKSILSAKLRGKKQKGQYQKRQGYYPEKEGNKLINYMKKAAEQQGKLPIKDRTYTNVFVDDKFVGVNDIKNNKLYTHIDYDLSKDGAKKGTVITKHPDYEGLDNFFKAAKKFKYESPDKLLGSYFSKYERVPTYNEMYNFFTVDRDAPVKAFTSNNGLTIHHQDVIAKNPTSNFQLLTTKKNTEANTIMNRLKRGEITEARANYDLNKIGAGQEGYGVPKEKITAGKGLGVAKRETVKLFKDAYKVNPNVVEDMTKKLLIKLEARGCGGKAAGGRILFSNGGEAITSCAKKGVQGFIDDLKSGNYSKATKDILKGGGNVIKNIVNPMELLKLKNLIGPGALGFMAAFEAGVITDDVIRQGTPLNESLANNWLTKSFLPYTKEYAEAKNLLETGKVPSNMKKYVQDVVTFNESLMDMKGIGGRKDSRLVDQGGYGMIDGSSMYSKEQEDKDVNNLLKKMSTISEDVITPGTGKALEMKSLQDEMEAARMAKPKIMGKGSYLDDTGMEQFSEGFQYSDGFSPIFGFDKLKDRNLTSVFDSYISATEDAPKDFRPITYQDAEYEDKKLPLGLEQLYMNKLNLKPRDSLKNYFFKDPEKNVLKELTDEYNAFKRQEEASKYPGYFGTQDNKFMQGGIASLNVKK
jgi:hypothetical protein